MNEIEIQERQVVVNLVREVIEWSRLSRRFYEWRLSLVTGQNFYNAGRLLFPGNGHKHYVLDVVVDPD